MGLTSWGSDQIININGNGGAAVPILATGPVRKYKITEMTVNAANAVNTPQGIIVTEPDDGFTQEFAIVPPIATAQDAKPSCFERGSDAAFHGPYGAPLGNGPNSPGAGVPPTTATVLCKVISLTATATAVRVEQWY